MLTSLPPPADARAADVHGRLLLLLSSAGHYALLPLLHHPAEWALARLLPLAWGCALELALRARRRRVLAAAGRGLRWWESAYLLGLAPLDLFCTVVHPRLLAPRLPFLPLMATSVYTALGVLYATALAYSLWARASNMPLGSKDE